MATARPNRPRSPHFMDGFLSFHYHWGPHMIVSILHRATGAVMATAGTVLFVWWLIAAASGAEAYATFLDVLTTDSGRLNVVGWVLGVGLSWAFFQHMENGVRHLFMDMGANFELRANRTSAIATIAVSVLLTAALWGWLILGR